MPKMSETKTEHQTMEKPIVVEFLCLCASETEETYTIRFTNKFRKYKKNTRKTSFKIKKLKMII